MYFCLVLSIIMPQIVMFGGWLGGLRHTELLIVMKKCEVELFEFWKVLSFPHFDLLLILLVCISL